MKKTLLLFLLVCVSALPMFANAGLVPCSPHILTNSQGQPILDAKGNVQFVDQCTFCSLFQLLKNIFNFMTWTLAVPVAVVTFIIGGLMMMLGGASTQSRTRALSIIRGTLMGLLIILLSWVIVSTVINIITGSTSGQPIGFPWPWNSVQCP